MRPVPPRTRIEGAAVAAWWVVVAVTGWDVDTGFSFRVSGVAA
jgi:hypothetical protein